MFGILALICTACSTTPSKPTKDNTSAIVTQIANEFVDGYFTQYTEEVYEIGYPNAPMDRFGHHDEQSITLWNAKVDRWLNTLNTIDIKTIENAETALTYTFAKEKIQALVDHRVCKMELWNISPTWTGWQFRISSTLAVQPVKTAEERKIALARVSDIARYLKTEIRNLRRGQQQGYAAGQNNVIKVIDQVTSFINTPITELPFYAPATKSNDRLFTRTYEKILRTEVRDAIIQYRDYLANEYKGHSKPGVSANPNGRACYDASVKFHASISMSAEDIYHAGITQMAAIQNEMRNIARSSFATDDVESLMTELRTNPAYTFKNEQDMLDYIAAAVERAKSVVGDWFGNVPNAEMIIVASPPYEKDSGGGFYSSGSADGERPGIYKVGTYKPTTISKAGQESTAFHESYPGHHLQFAVALTNQSAHPIFRYMYVGGSSEGWALYTEKLADEMGIYSDDLARLGMLSNAALRAARLVVDPGMHIMGWTRQEAIQYMLDHTAESIGSITNEVDRYAAVPGQATSYLIGSIEIQRLRQHAEEVLGDSFDIREFHDQVLMNGAVTLPMISAAVERWIRNK
nr:DUF885 domain-containing protein [Thalassotalea piscium]